MLYANYCNNKTLIISKDMNGSEVIAIYKVSGKREARAKAKELNATPWNF